MTWISRLPISFLAKDGSPFFLLQWQCLRENTKSSRRRFYAWLGSDSRVDLCGDPIIVSGMDGSTADSGILGDHGAVVVAMDNNCGIIDQDLLHTLDDVFTCGNIISIGEPFIQSIEFLIFIAAVVRYGLGVPRAPALFPAEIRRRPLLT